MQPELEPYVKLISNPTDENLGTLLDMLLEKFSAERGCFWVEDRQTVVYRGSEELKMSYPFSRKVVGAAVKTQLGFVSFDVSEDDRLAPTESIKASQIRSCLCVPMRDTDGYIDGVIYFDDKTSRQFTQQDLDFLIAVAAHFPPSE